MSWRKKSALLVEVISSYEATVPSKRNRTLKKLAEALGVNINYLLSEDEAFIADVEDNYGQRC